MPPKNSKTPQEPKAPKDSKKAQKRPAADNSPPDSPASPPAKRLRPAEVTEPSDSAASALLEEVDSPASPPQESTAEAPSGPPPTSASAVAVVQGLNHYARLNNIEVQALVNSSAVQGFMNSFQTTQPLGEEDDAIIQTYGHPAEGLNNGDHISVDEGLALVRRFLARFNLANLARYPEGYELRQSLLGGEGRAIRLLSPPDQVAVRRGDGTWFRRRRDEAVDGPCPYDMAFYMHYLRTNRLPHYFLRPEHTAMLDAHEESRWLGLDEAQPQVTPPPANYLAIRYPAAPLWPQQLSLTTSMTTQAPPPREARRNVFLPMLEGLGNRVARYFPATTALAVGSEYRIFQLPSGHIVIRLGQPDQDPAVLWPDVAEIKPEQIKWVPAKTTKTPSSYVQETDDNAAGAVADSPPVSRATLVEAFQADEWIVDIDQVPQGAGEWRWLDEDVDQARALALGYEDPVDVAAARGDGALTAGIPFNARPIIVYRPDRQYFNPDHQPEGNGEWRYFTTRNGGSSQDLAHLNFGGHEEHFPGNPTPTAAQIWELRQRINDLIDRGEREDDATAEIDLVWVPRGAPSASVPIVYSPGASPAPALPPPTAAPAPSATLSRADFDPQMVDDHNPTNDGKPAYNQTGKNPLYQSRLFDGRKYTLDRSRAQVNNKEDHKSWIFGRPWKNSSLAPKWKQWHEYGTIDWTDRGSVEKLNKWREQVGDRWGWPARRPGRFDYTPAQRNYVFEMIKAKNDGKLKPGEFPAAPDMSIPDILREYNNRWPLSRRDILGITSLLSRLRKEYNENDGKQKDHVGRGQNRKREHDQDESNDQADRVGRGNNKKPKTRKQDENDEADFDEHQGDDDEDDEE